MAGTIRILYYSRRGSVIHEQPTEDEYCAAEIRKWEAWLNDPNVEQACAFDQFEIVEDK